MTLTIYAILAIGLANSPPGEAQPPVGHSDPQREVTVETAAELQAIVADPVDDILVWIKPGEYRLAPTPYTDPTCGNCPPDRIDTAAKTTVGLHLRGGRIHLRAEPGEDRPVIHTNAGYGILIENCNDARIEGLTITGGKRSSDGNATDGAIVVRNAITHIANNHITDNLGDPEVVRKTVSGVMGIVGRENSNIVISGNEIVRNSWDGIALYRDANATILGNLIDGGEPGGAATGANIGGGRGVGIGITWNARALVRGNLVKRYWKGIGVFVDADAFITENVVEDILTWGISLWSAGDNNASAHIIENVVHRTGACGFSIASASKRENAGMLLRNAVARAAQNPAYDPSDRYCHQCALAIHRVPEHFKIEQNYFFENRRASDDLPDHDVDEDEFRAAIEHLCTTLAANEVLRESAFAREFCAENDDNDT